MADFFSDNFSDCVALAVFLLAMLPLVESKVAIPFGLSVELFGEATLTPACAFFVALSGSILPTIAVILLCKLIKKKSTGFVHEKFAAKIETRLKDKLEKVSSKNSTFKKCLALCAFVAIPLPLTGIYTGGLIAGFSKLTFWQGFVSILLGEVISCLAILVLCMLFKNSTLYILLTAVALIVLFVVINIISSLLGRFFKNRRR